mgnify:CR=1 FL=1
MLHGFRRCQVDAEGVIGFLVNPGRESVVLLPQQGFGKGAGRSAVADRKGRLIREDLADLNGLDTLHFIQAAAEENETGKVIRSHNGQRQARRWPGIRQNNAGRAHLEGFGNLEGVARAKGEMYTALPADGLAVQRCERVRPNLEDVFVAATQERKAQREEAA